MFEKKDVLYELGDKHILYQSIFKKIKYMDKTHLNIMILISEIYYLMILKKSQT